jgi:hypothetical protein
LPQLAPTVSAAITIDAANETERFGTSRIFFIFTPLSSKTLVFVDVRFARVRLVLAELTVQPNKR